MAACGPGANRAFQLAPKDLARPCSSGAASRCNHKPLPATGGGIRTIAESELECDVLCWDLASMGRQNTSAQCCKLKIIDWQTCLAWIQLNLRQEEGLFHEEWSNPANAKAPKA